MQIRTKLAALVTGALLAGSLGRSTSAAAADGDLDPTFLPADSGIFRTGTPGDAAVAKLLPAPDGSTVMLEHYTESDGTPRQDRWRRVTDASWYAYCRLTNPSVDGLLVSSAIFDSAGRLVVVGTDYDGTRQVVVERFLYPDYCTLDPEFDGNGIAAYLAGEDAIGVDLAALRVGVVPFAAEYYYLVATVTQPTYQVVVLRLHLDGSLDTSWGGGDGRVEAGITGGRVYARDAELDAHGRLVVAVQIEDLSPDDFDFGVFRFLSSGALDPNFDGNGKKAIPFDLVTNGNDRPHAIAISSDERIAIVGTVQGFEDEIGVAVLREDGSLETEFDGDGKLHTALDVIATGWSAIFESGGKLLVGGQRVLPLGSGPETAATETAFVARLLRDGSFDPSFSGDGLSSPGEPGWNGAIAETTSLALEAGRPMVGGKVWRTGEVYDAFLLRVENALIFADGFESRNTYWW